MRLQHHTAVSLTIAGVLYMAFKSWGLSLACLISGIFIDLDHLLDVVREHGWSIKVKDFFRICHHAQFDRIILIWHGWEWLFLLTISSWLTDWDPWITGTLIGFGQHMVLDTYFNNARFMSYSLIWRWKNNFDFDTVFPKFKVKKYKHGKYLSGQFNQ
ncbi:MAG: hypothetical protein HZC49_02400 [Nitrospirae bacterium]|nr:hypothetical protein [Nitrospirota bacterium]